MTVYSKNLLIFLNQTRIVLLNFDVDRNDVYASLYDRLFSLGYYAY